MTKPSISILSLLMLLPAGAMAGDWHGLTDNGAFRLEAREPVMEPGKGDKPGEPDSQKKDKKLTIWDKTTYHRPRQAVPGDFFYQSSQTLTAINCTTRAFKPLQKIYYSPEGNEIKSVRLDEAEKTNALVPDSPIESIFNYACAFAAPRATKPADTPAPTEKPASEPAGSAGKPPPTSKKKPAEDKPAATPAPQAKKSPAEAAAKK